MSNQFANIIIFGDIARCYMQKKRAEMKCPLLLSLYSFYAFDSAIFLPKSRSMTIAIAPSPDTLHAGP